MISHNQGRRDFAPLSRLPLAFIFRAFGAEVYVWFLRESIRKEKSAAVIAVRRANYTHRRKGVFNAEIIVDLRVGGNVRFRTNSPSAET